MSEHTDAYALAATRIDAKDRAWRTFVQNIWLDLVVLVGPILADAVTSWDGSFIRTYWVPVGISVAKTAALTIIAYWMRLKKTPRIAE